MNTSIVTKVTKEISKSDLLDLYSSVGWTAYTKDLDLLQKAIAGSSFVISKWKDDVLLGLARCVSDDATIMYLQDILVRPSHHRQGIGKELVQACIERYAHVRQTVLLTDDQPEQAAFYEGLGFSNIKVINSGKLNAFVKISI
ncbi:MAG: GNAT family N-acetyltransferase [Oligoflexales bacterium]